jgi:muramoyltetrapeptide carboxypeptidase
MNIIDSISSHSLWLKLNKKFKIIPISPASYPYCECKDIQSIAGINLYNNKPLLNKYVNPFHSNSDEKRFEDLYKALNVKDENVIIWCINGGYGSAKLIPFLENVAKPNVEKIFIGYSDITALHLFFFQKWGWKTIHGPCLGELFKKDKDINNFLNLFDCLLRKDFTNRKFVKCIKPLNLAAEKFKDQIDGYKFIGGNLALIQTSLGTNWKIDIKNKVLFLEDIGEAGYKVDRMLNHISSVLNIRTAKAIIFGEFINSDEFIDFTINNFANLNSSIPIYKTGKLGHGKYNLPVIYN